jgi:DNA-directed RNA polymerase subunit RPC12/RpoP
MRTCPNCGNKVSDTAKFCVECGTKLEEKKEIYCPNCNSLFTSGKFCMECGYNMQDFLNKKKVEKKNDDLLLGSLDFDPFGKNTPAQDNPNDQETVRGFEALDLDIKSWDDLP